MRRMEILMMPREDPSWTRLESALPDLLSRTYQISRTKKFLAFFGMDKPLHMVCLDGLEFD